MDSFRRSSAALLAVAGLAAPIVACSDEPSSDGPATTSATPTTSTSTSEPASSASALSLSPEQQEQFEGARRFADCLRQHGISDFPDPELIGDRYLVIAGPLDRDDDAMSSAIEACQPGNGGERTVGEEAESEEAEVGPQAVGAAWERHYPGGDCACSDGSDFSFWVHEASTQNVVLYLEDGGACFDAATCDPARGVYNVDVEGGPLGEGGMFDFGDERNPFADYSMVYVPYCTGDVHLGDATTEYAPGLTIQHKGLVNGLTALDHLAAAFPRATNVVVVGESAGSVSAPVYGALAADRVPDASVTVIADGSGSYPDDPTLTAVLAEAWRAPEALGALWPDGSAGEPLGGLPGLFVTSAQHQPGLVLARHDYAYDERQAMWYSIIGIPEGDLLQRIDDNATAIEAAGVSVASYVQPGDDHTVMTEDEFYTREVGGTPLVEWVANLIAGQPVGDVHCTECAPG